MARMRRKIKKSTVIYLTVLLSVLLFGCLSYGAFLVYRMADADVAVPGAVGVLFFYLSEELTCLASWVPFAAMAFAVSRRMKYTAWRSVALFLAAYVLFYFIVSALEYSSGDFVSYLFSSLLSFTLAVLSSGYVFTLITNLTFAVAAVLGALLARHIIDGRREISTPRRDAVILGASVTAPMLVSMIDYAVRFISASAFAAADFAAFGRDLLSVLLMNGMIPFAAGLLLNRILSRKF